MKKYVNGKILEMTEKDIERRNSRIAKTKSKEASDSQRIKELEETVALLMSKLSEEAPVEE